MTDSELYRRMRELEAAWQVAECESQRRTKVQRAAQTEQDRARRAARDKQVADFLLLMEQHQVPPVPVLHFETHMKPEEERFAFFKSAYLLRSYTIRCVQIAIGWRIGWEPRLYQDNDGDLHEGRAYLAVTPAGSFYPTEMLMSRTPRAGSNVSIEKGKRIITQFDVVEAPEVDEVYELDRSRRTVPLALPDPRLDLDSIAEQALLRLKSGRG